MLLVLQVTSSLLLALILALEQPTALQPPDGPISEIVAVPAAHAPAPVYEVMSRIESALGCTVGAALGCGAAGSKHCAAFLHHLNHLSPLQPAR